MHSHFNYIPTGRRTVICSYLLVCCLLVSRTGLNAQANTYSVSGWWGAPPPRFSPVVSAHGTIVFRIKAPSARKVQLELGEWNIVPLPMQKDSAGNWSVTVKDAAPGIYSYFFSVDGIHTPDLANPVVKHGTEVYGSIVEVPGNGMPRFDEIRNIPHGTLTISQYASEILKKMRTLYVYLPPDYSTQPGRQYPVLYLRHGGGDDESSWTQESGRANIILDNLIDARQAVPMIVVMSNGLTDGTWAGGSTKEGVEQLEAELVKEIKPLVEKQYRVLKGPEHTAIAGLSMGGGQAYIIGLRNPSVFSWIGEFSSGLLSDAAFKITERVPGAFSNVESFNKSSKLLFIGCGTDDPRLPGHLALAADLKKNKIVHEVYNIPGGHEWKVWREELRLFYTRLFK